MLFDTSIWIDFLRGNRNPRVDLLQQQIVVGIVHVCPPIFQEVLQGIKDDQQFEYVKERLINLNFLFLDPYLVAESAAKLYRHVRKKGTTIDKPNDCIIAFYAIHFNTPLVHRDKDFDKIARHTNLKIYAT